MRHSPEELPTRSGRQRCIALWCAATICLKRVSAPALAQSNRSTERFIDMLPTFFCPNFFCFLEEEKMKVYDILKRHETYVVVRAKALLESTGEEIEDLLCPYCDGEISEVETADWGNIISVKFYCAKCRMSFEDGLLCERKFPQL
jgi:hypothetical protein